MILSWRWKSKSIKGVFLTSFSIKGGGRQIPTGLRSATMKASRFSEFNQPCFFVRTYIIEWRHKITSNRIYQTECIWDQNLSKSEVCCFGFSFRTLSIKIPIVGAFDWWPWDFAELYIFLDRVGRRSKINIWRKHVWQAGNPQSADCKLSHRYRSGHDSCTTCQY